MPYTDIPGSIRDEELSSPDGETFAEKMKQYALRFLVEIVLVKVIWKN